MQKVLDYILNLKGNLENGLNSAHNKMQMLNKATEKTRGVMGQLAGILGTGMAIYKVFEFIKGGVEKVHELEQANAQLEATLKSTNEVVGISKKGLDDLTDSWAKKTKYGKADITMMQAQLTTFTNIKGVIYKQAIPAVLDLSQKMGQDLKSSAVQLGKALQDPEKGITALRRVGVNFTKTQQEMVTGWVKHGEVVKAQTFILKELQTEFGGSAEAAFKADPMVKLGKALEHLQISFGEMVQTLQKKLAPVLLNIVEYIQKIVDKMPQFVDWLKRNSTWLKAIGEGLLTIFVGYQFMKIIEGIKVMTQSMSLLGKSIPIIGWIAAIVAFISLIYDMIGGLDGFKATWDAMSAAVTFGIESMKLQFKSLGDRWDEIIARFELGGKIAKATLTGNWKDAQKFEKDYKLLKDNNRIEEKNQKKKLNDDLFAATAKYLKVMKPLLIANGSIPKGLDMNGVGKGALSGLIKTPEEVKAAADAALIEENQKKMTDLNKVKGNGSTNITISIENIVKQFEIVTTTIKESSTEIKDLVGRALVEAVNDVALIGGRY